MARSQQFVDGYRRASRDAVTLVHSYAEKFVDPAARNLAHAIAFSLGNDALRATPDVNDKKDDDVGNPDATNKEAD